MMAEKPRPEDTAEEAIPAKEETITKKKSPKDAVEDLERRLKLLGDESSSNDNAPVFTNDVPAFALAAPAEQKEPAASASTVKGGKNALLVR